MFVCGKNQFFQLNKTQNSNAKQYINPPIKFHINPSLISSFSTNFEQTVWITHEGKSYVTGDNRNGIISGSLPKKKYFQLIQNLRSKKIMVIHSNLYQ